MASFITNDYACQVCVKHTLQFIKEFETLPRITSDCRPFPAGGKLAVCMYCGAVQKIADSKWRKEIAQIYQDYQAYRIAKGIEQLVLDPQTGLPKKRSVVLMEQLKHITYFSHHMQVMDIGCGDGVTLQAMSDTFPTWHLYGHELESKKLNQLVAIPTFQQLFTGELSAIHHTFDFITMIHSLEHFSEPSNTLSTLRKKLSPQGYLFIQVCNIEENPFDLLIADHLMHFSPASLSNITELAGFHRLELKKDWVKKEISFLATVATPAFSLSVQNTKPILEKIKQSVTWLSMLMKEAKSIATLSNSFGIFGTSIAASWLAAELGDLVKFFVDEDPHRIGQQYMNKPVFSPDKVPPSSAVYLALAPILAAHIAKRLHHSSWSFVGASS